jgi:hypothetical protein
MEGAACSEMEGAARSEMERVVGTERAAAGERSYGVESYEPAQLKGGMSM